MIWPLLWEMVSLCCRNLLYHPLKCFEYVTKYFFLSSMHLWCYFCNLCHFLWLDHGHITEEDLQLISLFKNINIQQLWFFFRLLIINHSYISTHLHCNLFINNNFVWLFVISDKKKIIKITIIWKKKSESRNLIR